MLTNATGVRLWLLAQFGIMLIVLPVVIVCLAQMVTTAQLVSRRLAMLDTTVLHRISRACAAQQVLSALKVPVSPLLALAAHMLLEVPHLALLAPLSITQRKQMLIAHQFLQVSLRTDLTTV
jgi:hypothetical protein